MKVVAFLGVIAILVYWLRPSLFRHWSRNLWPRRGRSIPAWWQAKTMGQQITTALFWLVVLAFIYMMLVGTFDRMV